MGQKSWYGIYKNDATHRIPDPSPGKKESRLRWVIFFKYPKFDILPHFTYSASNLHSSFKPRTKKEVDPIVSTTLPLNLQPAPYHNWEELILNYKWNFSWKFLSRQRDRRNKRIQAAQTHSPDRTQFVQIWDKQRQPCRRQTGCRVPFPPPGRDRSGCACQAGDTTAVQYTNFRKNKKLFEQNNHSCKVSWNRKF